ncbi:hypothetical protein [Pedobacter faecalis]|uniref:hypothetical protein n=1 Tax=Pedobacter faecalis TaxID=3041495 RepID=UPI00254BB6BA|nr:hypothetical protein [Pedobacter sp. ELA7]
MKVILDIKARTLSDENAILVDEIKEAVEDLKLVRQGKLKARPARNLVNEL